MSQFFKELPQHNDHIWITIQSENWAIKALHQIEGVRIIELWRGYVPNLEYLTVVIHDWDIEGYVENQAEYLRLTDEWPNGCIKPNSCSRNKMCVYAMSQAQCRHFGTDIRPAVAEAMQRNANNGLLPRR